MSKSILIVFVTLTLLFLLTGGYQAAIAFWIIIGIVSTLVFIIIGLEKLLKRGKR